MGKDLSKAYTELGNAKQEKTFRRDAGDDEIVYGQVTSNSSGSKIIPDLLSDYTTPFACNLGKSNKQVYYQYFEFAYYNYQRGSSTAYTFTNNVSSQYSGASKYYNAPGDGDKKLPIMHSMYLLKNIGSSAPLSFSGFMEPYFDGDGNPENWTEHLMENDISKLYTFWPNYSNYSEWCYGGSYDTSLDLYTLINYPSGNCTGVVRVASAMAYDGGASNNSNCNTNGPEGIPFAPTLYTGGYKEHFGFGNCLTFCGLSASEDSDYRLESSGSNPTPKVPICESCVELSFPKIGLEGGTKSAAYEGGIGGSANTSFYDPGLLSGFTYWWKDHYSRLATYEFNTETGEYECKPLPGYEHGTNWVWAEEWDKYDQKQCSVWEELSYG